VIHSGGAAGGGAAQAGLGAAADGLAADWTAPVPVYRPMPLAGEPLFQPDENQLIAGLTERGGAWRHLSSNLRFAMDEAVAAPARRAPWRRLVIEGTGEEMGSAGDLAVAGRRGGISSSAFCHWQRHALGGWSD
jgi:hypothetical protein